MLEPQSHDFQLRILEIDRRYAPLSQALDRCLKNHRAYPKVIDWARSVLSKPPPELEVSWHQKIASKLKKAEVFHDDHHRLKATLERFTCPHCHKTLRFRPSRK